jgi:hypothetical protein
LPVTSAHTYRLYIFKEQGFVHRSEVRILQTSQRNSRKSFAPSRCRVVLRYREGRILQSFFISSNPYFLRLPVTALFALHQEGAHYIDPNIPVKGF